MAARRPDIARGWGAIEIVDAFDRRAAAGALVSHDARNRTLVWRPGPAMRNGRAACDLESCARPVPAICRALLPGSSALEFLAAWTATEVVAKLLGVPIMTWIRAHGLVACPPRRAMRHAHGGSLVALRNAVLPRYEAVITLGYTAGNLSH